MSDPRRLLRRPFQTSLCLVISFLLSPCVCAAEEQVAQVTNLRHEANKQAVLFGGGNEHRKRCIKYKPQSQLLLVDALEVRA